MTSTSAVELADYRRSTLKTPFTFDTRRTLIYLFPAPKHKASPQSSVSALAGRNASSPIRCRRSPAPDAHAYAQRRRQRPPPSLFIDKTASKPSCQSNASTISAKAGIRDVHAFSLPGRISSIAIRAAPRVASRALLTIDDIVPADVPTNTTLFSGPNDISPIPPIPVPSSDSSAFPFTSPISSSSQTPSAPPSSSDKSAH